MASKTFRREAQRRTLPRVAALTKADKDALRLVYDGADVHSYTLAHRLRQIHRNHPDLLTITALKNKYNPLGVMPYFGAILTAKGKKAVVARG